MSTCVLKNEVLVLAEPMGDTFARKPRRDGETRRLSILLYLRENPDSIHSDIARGVGYATHRGHAPALNLHLEQLHREGLVACDGRRWRATA